MFNRILVTTDGSKASHSALPHAGKLAEGLGCEVVLLYVLQGQSRDDVQQEHQQTQEQGRRVLDQAAELLGLPGVSKLLLNVQHNDVATTITKAAKDQGADLIVMASRGSTGLNHLLMGCIAERVMHRAHVPVLLVRDPQAGESVKHGSDTQAATGAAAS
jgi:nucleotide-binding universal stress UspA family protein